MRRRGMMPPDDEDPAPRGAIPNWQPAATLEDYLRNCHEGLEDYSDRRAAKVLGWSRIEVFRARLMARIPGDLFERLLDAGTPPMLSDARIVAG